MFDNISDEDLEAELNRRKEIKKAKAVPKQLPSLDFEPLLTICQDYINDIAEDGNADYDYCDNIFETAIECIYGEDVWHWINSGGKI